MTKRFDYLYITARNSIMGRSDSETYTKENQGKILAVAQNCLESARAVAYDLAIDEKLEPTDIIISLNHKELRTITND